MTADQLGVDLSGINDVSNVLLTISPSAATANKNVKALNAVQASNNGVPFYLDPRSGGAIRSNSLSVGTAVRPLGDNGFQLSGPGLSNSLDALGFAAEFLGGATRYDLTKITASALGSTTNTSTSVFAVNAAGEASSATRIAIDSQGLGVLRSEFLGSELVTNFKDASFNPYSIINTSRSEAAIISGRPGSFSQVGVTSAEYLETRAVVNNSALGRIGKIVGGPEAGAALTVFEHYNDPINLVSPAHAAVGRVLDATVGYANSTIADVVGIAAGVVSTPVLGPYAIAAGGGAAFATSYALDQAYNYIRPYAVNLTVQIGLQVTP